MLAELGVSSRSMLNAYCNYLRIRRGVRYFTQYQREQILELRHWVLQGKAISDFLLKSQKLGDCA